MLSLLFSNEVNKFCFWGSCACGLGGNLSGLSHCYYCIYYFSYSV